MARRTGQYGDDNYGKRAEETRPRPSADAVFDVAEIREKLFANKGALTRLKRIVASGASESDPLVYEVRPPAGSRHLLKWGCINLRSVDGRVHVWPLPFALQVLEEGSSPPRSDADPTCAHCGSSRAVVGRYVQARPVDVAEGRVLCCSDSTHPDPDTRAREIATGLTTFEADVLADRATTDPRRWGGAIGQALEVLRSSGCVSECFDVTDLGHAVIRMRAQGDDTHAEAQADQIESGCPCAGNPFLHDDQCIHDLAATLTGPQAALLVGTVYNDTGYGGKNAVARRLAALKLCEEPTYIAPLRLVVTKLGLAVARVRKEQDADG